MSGANHHVKWEDIHEPENHRPFGRFCLTAGSLSATECIALGNPSGGWDFTCRQIGKILHDIGAVNKPVQVTSMPGGGGLAYTHVVT